MPSRKELCRNWKLYVITDKKALGDKALFETVREAILGGASVIQLRDKEAGDQELVSRARELLILTRAAGIPLIINDRPQVARKSGADGVHLGQGDASISDARKLLGRTAIVGRSTHTREQALAAQAEGYDYIGVGPVFATPTKPRTLPVGLDLVRFAAGNISIPFVAIGGINTDNILDVKKAGAKTIAVVRAVMASQEPQKMTRRLCEMIA